MFARARKIRSISLEKCGEERVRRFPFSELPACESPAKPTRNLTSDGAGINFTRNLAKQRHCPAKVSRSKQRQIKELRNDQATILGDETVSPDDDIRNRHVATDQAAPKRVCRVFDRRHRCYPA